MLKWNRTVYCVLVCEWGLHTCLALSWRGEDELARLQQHKLLQVQTCRLQLLNGNHKYKNENKGMSSTVKYTHTQTHVSNRKAGILPYMNSSGWWCDGVDYIFLVLSIVYMPPCPSFFSKLMKCVCLKVLGRNCIVKMYRENRQNNNNHLHTHLHLHTHIWITHLCCYHPVLYHKIIKWKSVSYRWELDWLWDWDLGDRRGCRSRDIGSSGAALLACRLLHGCCQELSLQGWVQVQLQGDIRTISRWKLRTEPIIVFYLGL